MPYNPNRPTTTSRYSSDSTHELAVSWTTLKDWKLKKKDLLPKRIFHNRGERQASAWGVANYNKTSFELGCDFEQLILQDIAINHADLLVSPIELTKDWSMRSNKRFHEDLRRRAKETVEYLLGLFVKFDLTEQVYCCCCGEVEFQARPDLIGITKDGELCVIELKYTDSNEGPHALALKQVAYYREVIEHSDWMEKLDTDQVSMCVIVAGPELTPREFGSRIEYVEAVTSVRKWMEEAEEELSEIY